MINVGSVVVKDVFDNVCIVANPERIVFQNGLIIKMDIKYDYLIVGSGLYGATFAYKAKQAGRKVLVIDKRPHLGGNVYCENVEVSMCINMERTSFILIAKKYGIS